MKIKQLPTTWAIVGPRDANHQYYMMISDGELSHGYLGFATVDLAKKMAEQLFTAIKNPLFAIVYTIGPDGKTQRGERLRRGRTDWEPWKIGE